MSDQKEEFYAKYDDVHSAEMDRQEMASGCRKGILICVIFFFLLVALLIWFI